MHVPYHSWKTILNQGPLPHSSTFTTERMYQWDKHNSKNSGNDMKTAFISLLDYTFNSIALCNYSPKPSSDDHSYKPTTLSKRFKPSVLEECFEGLTRCNYYDCVIFYHCDCIPFMTSLDRFLEKKESTEESYPYYSPAHWSNTVWNEGRIQYTCIKYNGVVYKSLFYYVDPSEDNIDKVIPHVDCIGFLKLWNGQLALFLPLSFVSI